MGRVLLRSAYLACVLCGFVIGGVAAQLSSDADAAAKAQSPPAAASTSSSAHAAAAELPPKAAPPDSVSASSEVDAAHAAKFGMDNSNGTVWISASPVNGGHGQWIARAFPAPVTVVAYSIGSWIDSRFVTADSPEDWALQASDDGGSTWVTVDRVTNETSWLIAETRTYLVPRPPGGYKAHSRYRLLVDRVPGRSGGESHVAIRELQFTTAEALPAPCVGLESVAVGMNIMAGPPPSRSDPIPYYLITVLPAITNTGLNPVNVLGLSIPMLFSRKVRSVEGAWSVAPPADFRIAFNGASVTDGTHWTPVDRYTSIAFSNASNSVVISFAAPIVLCPGCTLSGPGGDPIFTLAHKDSLTLDHQSLSVGDISCGSKAVQVEAVTVSDPEVMLTPAEAAENPACSAWSGGKAPPCPGPDALAALRISTSVKEVLAPDALPAVGAGANASAVRALLASSAVNPSELLLSVHISNNGRSPVSLAGVTFALELSSHVKVPTFDRWVVAGPDEYVITCWWGQVNELTGARPSGDGNACKYIAATKTETGLNLEFLGGSLCSGCSLVGAVDGTMFSIKHESYLQLEASSKSLKAVGAPTCTPLARPPPNCGVKGFDNSPLPKPGHDCPRPEDISMYLALEPFPTDAMANASNPAATEMRIVPVVANAGSRSLSLSKLRIPIRYTREVKTGDDFLVRPPEEFNWTCWYGQVQGPGSDYSDVCRVAVMDATPSGFQLGFSDGYVAPGNSLVGGENGVLGTISHIYYIPLNAAAFGVKQAVCQERDNSTVVYSVSQGRIGAAVPPPAQPPPAAAHVAAAKDGAMGSGGLASVSTAALVHPVGTTGFATAGGGAAAAGSSSGSLPQQQPRAAVPPQSTGGPAKELIPPPPPPNKAAVNNPLTGGWMANPFIGG